jgi:hypothetical protein
VRARDACRAAGLSADERPADLSGDDYKWGLRVWRAGETRGEDCVDVNVELAEAFLFGEQDNPYGVTFAVSIVEWGGRILGGLEPYNYTPRVWVDARAAAAVAERWALIAAADVNTIASVINGNTREHWSPQTLPGA